MANALASSSTAPFTSSRQTEARTLMQTADPTIPATAKPKRRRWPIGFLLFLAALGALFRWFPREQSLTDPRLLQAKAPNKNLTETFFWDDSGRLSWFHVHGIWRFEPSLASWKDVGPQMGGAPFGIWAMMEVVTPPGTGPTVAHIDAMCILSPDGRKLLSQEYQGDPKEWVWACQWQNAPNHRPWRSLASMGDPYWMPDSRRWVGIREGAGLRTRLVVSDVEKPGRPVEFPIAKLPPPGGLEILGAWGPNEIAALEWVDIEQTVGEVSVYSIAPTFALLKRYRVSLPQGFTAEDKALSFRTHQMAWRIKREATTSVWQKIVSRVLRRPLAAHEELWVCDENGAHWRSVGYLDNVSDIRQINKIQWLPDGKRVSVLIGDTIYVVPTD